MTFVVFHHNMKREVSLNSVIVVAWNPVIVSIPVFRAVVVDVFYDFFPCNSPHTFQIAALVAKVPVVFLGISKRSH